MRKESIVILTALASAAAYGAQERDLKMTNQVRLGFDDNIYLSETSEESAFLSDIFNLSSELDFSTRTKATLSWQPEVHYRVDGDPEFVTYQDFKGELEHSANERLSLSLSDRLRYQQKDAQNDLQSRDNQNFVQNNLDGQANYVLGKKDVIQGALGHELRRWDDDTFADNNDYDQFKLSAAYVRELSADTTKGTAAITYADREYEGTRGGYDSTTLYGGVEHIFSSELDAYVNLGWSMSSVESFGDENDTTTPFFETGANYQATEKTAARVSFSYSLQEAENSVFNAAEATTIYLGVSHDLSAKVAVASGLQLIHNEFDSDYGTRGDSDEDVIAWDIRGTYQIDRNNFVEVGYSYQDRSGDIIDYDRSRFDIGWRINL